MAWNIAGVSRRTRDAAVEAARRAGMGLEDWLDEAVAGHAGLDRRDEPDRAEGLAALHGPRADGRSSERPIDPVDKSDSTELQSAPGDRLDAAAVRLERIARQQAAAEPRAPGTASAFDSAIERFGMRLARAEAQAARAFESIAQILERDTAARQSDRRALVDAVRRLESIRAGLSASAQANEARADGFSRPPQPHPKPPFDLKAAVSQIAMRRHEIETRAAERDPGQLEADRQAEGGSDAPPEAGAAPTLGQLLLDDVRALSRKVDEMRRERSDQSAAVDLEPMRAEIEAMRRSLADLAPRNAVVALEGAIRDLMQRVETLRQGGHGESMLAPLEAMAAEFRAAVQAHDPQAAAAGLEREIRAIGARIDGLAATAIDPETFERIRRQTEEVRDLLAQAALRTPPLERLERQIGDLADRVERLGASPAPQFESAEMAAALQEACRQVERSTSPAALASIERRLEQIATRLDQEIARPSASASIDPGPFDDLARRIDSVRRALEALPSATIDAGHVEGLLRELGVRLDAAGTDANALQSTFAEIRDKLDRLADGGTSARELEPVLHELGARIDKAVSPVDLNPIETLMRSLEAKFEASANAPVDREVVEQVADALARRLNEASARQVDLQAVAHQVDTISDRIDTLAAQAAANDAGPMMQELLERLRDADRAEGSSALETSAAVYAALDTHLTELKAEQASAEKRTQSRLSDLQDVLQTLTARLASIETELTADDIDEEARPPARAASPSPSASSAARGAEVAPRSPAPPAAGAEPPRSADGEDLLIEPGAGAPERAREARELAQAIGLRTNPAVSAHITAARRAAQAALAENGAAPVSGAVKILTGAQRAPFAARGVQTARAFYASHKRTVLLGVAIAIAATLAVRMAGVRAPFLQRSELDGPAVNAAKADAPKGKPADQAGPAKRTGEAIDIAPTASIAQPPVKPGAPDLAPEGGPSASALPLAIPPGISLPLRDAVAAGQANAQYEVAMRLIDGRGLPKDQAEAARWFERAASLGLAPAQYRLGSMYEKGIGVARDPAAAKRWYRKAAEAGNARAAHNLAVMNADPASGEANYLEAAKWFRKAAELGLRDSQYNLAILYAQGLGVDKNLGQSFLWFSLAAQQGDQDAAKKRDEIAGQMDPASLASAVEALMRFKAVKPDPAANEVASPPGGWDAKPGALGQSPADAARPQAPL